MILALVFIVIGLVVLTWSADHLVENASALASRFGVSTFIVGVVVIGFGTSAPELFVSAMASLENKGNLALGNALGSNITNIGLVLGSAAFISVIAVNSRITRREIPMLLLTGIIAVGVLLDGQLSRLDGLLLFGLLIGFLSWSVFNSKTAPDTVNELANDDHRSTLKISLWTISNIALLIIASRLLVEGATTIATHFGVSDLVIGLTIVAIGTSLPELAASISAARKNTHDMIVGNIIGSNIFNTLGVLGVSGLIRATEIDTTIIWRDFPIMFLFTFLMWVFAFTQNQFKRREGLVLIIAYISYVCYLGITTLS